MKSRMGGGARTQGEMAVGGSSLGGMSAIEERHVKLLDEEIKKVMEEKKKYKRLQADYKKRFANLDQAEAEFDKRRDAEIENIRVMKEKAEKKIKRDRRVLDQQSRTLLSKIPSKKDREEIQQLEELIEKERATHKRKERTHKMNEDRLRRQIAELARKNDELKDENRRLEKRNLDFAERKGPSSSSSSAAAAEKRDTVTRKSAGFSGREPPAVVRHTSTPSVREQPKATAPKTSTTTTSSNANAASKTKTKVYPNGTKKEIHPNGLEIILFTNGDVKKSFPSSGKAPRTEYYYSEVDTWHTTRHEQGQYSGIEVFHFTSGQIEAHFPNGTKEVLFPDGIAHRLTDPEGEEHQIIDPEDLCPVFRHRKPQIS